MHRPRSTGGRVAVAAAAVVGLLLVVSAVVDRLAPEPRGPASSSYATSPQGLAAYADLLRSAGHPVARRRTPVDEPPALRPDTTLVVLDADVVAPREAQAIGRFVAAGGTLIAGGAVAAPWLETALPGAPGRQGADPGTAGPLAPAPETAGVRTVRTLSGGGWRRIGAGLPVLGPPERPLALAVRRGTGRALLLADASPLQNRGLALADDAALGLAAAGPRGRTVTFLETVHGYGTGRGLAALPARADWMLLGLLAAGLAFAWAGARRLGPPEDDEPATAPPRSDYVDALAGTLLRAHKPAETAAPLHTRARSRLTTRAGLPPDAGPQAVREAAARFGLSDDEAAALVSPPGDLASALAAGRALARLDGGASVLAVNGGERR